MAEHTASESDAPRTAAASDRSEKAVSGRQGHPDHQLPATSAKGAHRPEKYIILHGLVGSRFYQGSIVDASEFEDPDTLVELGAIAPHDGTYAEIPTLHEAIHSSSPPTLPNAPFVDATEQEKYRAAGVHLPEVK